MKRLLVFVITLFLLHTAKAITPLSPDSSRTAAKAREAQLADTIMVPVVTKPVVMVPYQSNIYKRRLDSISQDVQLDYNEYVQAYINQYLDMRENIGRVLGLSKYYFPIYERVFREAGIPEEIKYLSIVESQLNPYAVSRVGATGPWQFMSNTAKTYDLAMDNYVDERRDPIQSSIAAAAYLKDAYQQFGDWLLAIASYNCGKSNVIRAIEQAGTNNFWAIRQYLPAETRGYVPAFIAVTYVMNYYKKYNINPQSCTLAMNTDTVSVDKFVSLNSVSHYLSVDLGQLTLLNPSYKRMIVNGTTGLPKRLILPKSAMERYASSYHALNTDVTFAAPVAPAPVAATQVTANNNVQTTTQQLNTTDPKKKSGGVCISYRVQPGDTLAVIAGKFNGASVEDIKAVNGLKNTDVQPGMMLLINKD